MKSIINWKNYLLIYIATLVFLNLILLNLPLTNVFGYEFSAINAVFITFLSGIYIISFFKKALKESSKPGLISCQKNLSFLLLIPFLISILNSVFTGFCSFADGLYFYLVITVPSLVIGSALGIIAFAIIPRFRITVFIFLFLIVLSIAFFEIYFNPQTYLYNPVFGYFPGTIYDEGLSVDKKLFLYRVLNTIFFLGVLILIGNAAMNRKKKTVIWRRVAFMLIVAVIFYFIFSPLFGFSTTFLRLKNELPVRLETEHFITYADSEIEEKTLKYIALNQEYFYTRLSVYLEEDFEEKINSFIFRSSQQKKKLFGSGNADVAKPWQNSIYISVDSWESSLKHEIAHCFAGKFGRGIFKIATDFNPALIEGVAEACDGFYDELNLHYLAALAFGNNYKLSLTGLFTGLNFFGNVSGLSYICAGSFTKYLIERFGIQKLKQFYMTNDFERSYSLKPEDVETEYLQFLNSLNAGDKKDAANYYFGRKPLIRKVCPRYISDRLKIAWDLLNRKKFSEAQKYFRDILGKTINYSAVSGLAMIYEKTDSLNVSIKFLEDNIKNFAGTAYEYDLKFRTAELMVKAGRQKEAKQLYENLAAAKPSIRFEILARTRLDLFQGNDIAIYVSGSDFDKYFLLKKNNSSGDKKEYGYHSIPLMIELSSAMKENYNLFLSNFAKGFEVNDFYSSYAALSLSQYMLKNFDYANSRKMAGLSMRFKDDYRLSEFQKENLLKAEWFYKNAERISGEMNIVKDFH